MAGTILQQRQPAAVLPRRPPCACGHCASPEARFVACRVCGKGYLLAADIAAGRVAWRCPVCKRVNTITEAGHMAD